MPAHSYASVVIGSQELVQRAMDKAGVDKPGQLAKVIGLEAYASPLRVKRWLEGIAKPDYEATLILLRYVGLLRETPGQAVSGEWLRLEASARRFLQGVAELEASQDPPESPRANREHG